MHRPLRHAFSVAKWHLLEKLLASTRKNLSKLLQLTAMCSNVQQCAAMCQNTGQTATCQTECR